MNVWRGRLAFIADCLLNNDHAPQSPSRGPGGRAFSTASSDAMASPQETCARRLGIEGANGCRPADDAALPESGLIRSRQPAVQALSPSPVPESGDSQRAIESDSS